MQGTVGFLPTDVALVGLLLFLLVAPFIESVHSRVSIADQVLSDGLCCRNRGQDGLFPSPDGVIQWLG